jgi:hypothetical protein
VNHKDSVFYDREAIPAATTDYEPFAPSKEEINRLFLRSTAKSYRHSMATNPIMPRRGT